MNKIVPFPIKQASFGAIRNHHLSIECMDCGNTKRFYGKAMTYPFIAVDREEHDPHKYSVTEVGYGQTGYVEEVIESCAHCGSTELDIQVLKKDSE